jgi:hypothetical protein
VGGEAGAEGRRLCGMVADDIEFGGLLGACSGLGVGRASDVDFRLDIEVVAGKTRGGGGRGSRASESDSIALM